MRSARRNAFEDRASAERGRPWVGLVNRVVPWDLLGEETLQLAWQILAASSYTVGLGKQAFYRQLALDHAGAYAVAEPVMVENALAADAQEGMRAFLEKRQPRWQQEG